MASVLFEKCPVVVRGGGDLASGVIYKLVRAGFPVTVTELERPKLVRRRASFGEVMYSQHITIDGVNAHKFPSYHAEPERISNVDVWVYRDGDGKFIRARDPKPMVVVDARMEKRNIDTLPYDAKLVIALGPGFTAGVDCHAVIETKRGHNLGRVIYQGTAEPDSGEPDPVQGISHERVLRSPAAGCVIPELVKEDGNIRFIQIGDMIKAGQVIATVAGQPVIAPFSGVLRGLIHESVEVTPGLKIGDLDSRGRREYCFSISDKARAIGGGVLEAILAAPQIRKHLK